jgi:hypothetical protein
MSATASTPTEAVSEAEIFSALRDQLLAAVAAFVERVFNTSDEMLRSAIRVMHVYLKDYLQDVAGASVHWSRTVGLPAIAARSYRILRDPQIAGRFGVNAVPRTEWPAAVDANGSKLVEQISAMLIPTQLERISRGIFNDKQQLALRGAEGLATVIDYDGDPDPSSVNLLITKCYNWYAARGRVLQLPVAIPPPAKAAIESTPSAAGPSGRMSDGMPASVPAIEVMPTAAYGNRSLFGPAG